MCVTRLPTLAAVALMALVGCALGDVEDLGAHLRAALHDISEAIPLPASLPGACTNRVNQAPEIRTDVYYILEYLDPEDTQVRGLGHGTLNGRTPGWERYYTPGLPVQCRDISNRADPAGHWRFIPSSKYAGRWTLVNSYSGQHLAVGSGLVLTMTTEEPTSFDVSPCDADGKVVLTMIGLKDGYIRRDRSNCQFAVAASSWPITMRTACCQACPAGWRRTAEITMACLVCDQEDCASTTGPYEYQKVPIKFRLVEIPNFYAPDVPSPPSQTVCTDPAARYIAATGVLLKAGITVLSGKVSYGSWTIVAGQIVNKFGNLAKVASVGLGVLGIALSVAIDMTQPSVQSQLAELESKIMATVGNLISDTVVGMAVQQAANLFKTARFRLNTEIKSAKKTDFAANDLAEIDDDADMVKNIAASINQGLDLIKPAGTMEPSGGNRADALTNPTIADTPTNVKLIQQGYLLYVSGVLDMMAALSEAVMLDAYAHPETLCADIMADVGLSAHVDRQGFFLEQMLAFLVVRRTKLLANHKNSGKYTGWTAVDAFYNIQMYYTGSDDNAHTGNAVVSMRRNEIQWDMDAYAYRFSAVRDALSATVWNTQNMCEALRTDASTKQQYAQCAQGVGVGC